MAGNYGAARAADVVPNGPIIPIANLALPGTLTLKTYESFGGAASILMIACSGTFSVATSALPTAGVSFPADTVIYLPVNGHDGADSDGNSRKLFFNGSGTLRSTLLTTRANAGD